MNKKLIAKALLTIAANSTTEIIDSSDNKELIAAAEKIGLVIPSPDLSVIKTVYAEIDKVNLNGVILHRKAVEKGIKTLVGKQINWEHDGAGRICGYTIAASINGDKIEIIGVIFKSLFPEEMETLEEKFAQKKLAVSFEIWNRDMKGNSVVTEDANGFLVIDPILFHGTGLLLDSKPACPKAKVYKLLAKSDKLIIDAEKIAEKVFNENLLYAELALEKPECKKCKTCNCGNKEGVMEEAKKLCSECKEPLAETDTDGICAKCKEKKEKAVAEPEKIEAEKVIAPIEPEKKIEEKIESTEAPKTEEKAKEETKIEAIAPVAETNLEPAKVEEPKKEEAQAAECLCVEERPVKVVSEYTSYCTETLQDDGSYKSESMGKSVIIKTFKDGRTEVENRDNNSMYNDYVTKYTITQSQLDEAVKTANDAKDVEINSLKAEIETKKVEVSTAKAEIETIKTELGQKNQEIETLTAKKEEPKAPLDLNVGDVGTKNNDKWAERRAKIDERAFGKKKS